MGLSLGGGSDDRGGIARGGYIRLQPPEHSRTVYYNQAHYVPVSGGGVDDGVKVGQAVVGSGHNGFVGDADGGLRGGTDRVGGGDRLDVDVDGYILCRWEDNVSHITLGTEPNAPLSYAPGLELHHLIMSTLGEHGGKLEREREKVSE